MPTSTNDAPDTFVPDPVVARELGVTLMTVWRYDHDPAMAKMGWPVKVQIGSDKGKKGKGNRNFRSRHQLEAFKAAMLRKAMAARQKLVTA